MTKPNTNIDSTTPDGGAAEYRRVCVSINAVNIQDEFIRVPADLAFWNDRYSDAIREYLVCEADVKRVKAQLNLELRAKFADEGLKTTEPLIAAEVASSKQYQDAKILSIEAEVEKSKLYGVVDAIRTKKEMLISLGAQLRAEMTGDPLLRKQVAAERQ